MRLELTETESTMTVYGLTGIRLLPIVEGASTVPVAQLDRAAAF
jgi:hypothetical protein